MKASLLISSLFNNKRSDNWFIRSVDIELKTNTSDLKILNNLKFELRFIVIFFLKQRFLFNLLN